jgi:hypothetical protein
MLTGLCIREGSLGPVHSRLEAGRVDHQNELALLDIISLLNRELDDSAGHVRADVDGRLGFDVAGSGDTRDQVLSSDVLHPHRDPFAITAPHYSRHNDEDRHYTHTDRNLALARHISILDN